MVKRIDDWYKLQKDYGTLTEIPADLMVYHQIHKHNWKINFEHCHYGLQNLFNDTTSYTEDYDFAIITDIELSKLKLSQLVDLVKNMYTNSRHGVYFSALSYYLNPDITDKQLCGDYSENIDTVFSKLFAFADQIEEYSEVYDYPLQTRWIKNKLHEGANYIFVHPNIRYFLWKNK